MAKSSLPNALLPLKYLSVFWWSFSAMCSVEFSDLRLECTDEQLIELPSPPGGSQIMLCPFLRGRSILQFYQIAGEDEPLALSCGMLLILNVSARFIVLKLLERQSARATFDK